MKKLLKGTMIIAVTFFALAAFGQDYGNKMINIKFEDKTQEGMFMNMSLPVSFLATLKPQIEQALTSIQLGETNINIAEIWRAVRDSGPTAFVEANTPEADVQVSTTDTHLLVKVNEKGEDEVIDVTIPLALGDALFSNLENIDYDGIIKALVSMKGDLVVLKSDTKNGRIWIE